MATRRNTRATIQNVESESIQSWEENYSSEHLCSEMSVQNMSRTSLLILDYKQYKAARVIQITWQRYNHLNKFRNRTKAAITIQRWWRGFWVRNNHFSFVENMLQERLTSHYNKSATKIQALFRGWRVRQTVHDHSRLCKMQICAAEDLLNCVAFKLHHLLRTYTIPGVYSLKNSNCLSRVEKLLTSLHFRFRNGRVKSQKAENEADQRAEENDPGKRKCQRKVPNSQKQYWSQCKPQCYDILKMSKDMDRRMYRIIEMYDEGQKKANAAARPQKRSERKKATKQAEIHAKHLEIAKKALAKYKRDFCGDVIASMRRWNFLVENKINVDKNVFRNPENLEKFLTEISELTQEYKNCSCYCHIPVFDEIYCG